MKRILILVSMFLLAMMTNSLLSQPEQYESLEIINGSPTGYTNVITLNWINSDTVQVTKTQRISTGGDEATSFEIAGLDYTATDHEFVFDLEDNIWIIPFDLNESPAELTGSNYKFGCSCTVGLGCNATGSSDPNTGTLRVTCEDDGCATHGKCTPWIEEIPHTGTGLILRAETVIIQ